MTDCDRVEAVVTQLCQAGAGLAVFDADGVLWREDAGNTFLLWQVKNHILLPETEREARDGWEAYTRGELGELELAVLCASVLRGLPEAQVAAQSEAFFNEHILPHAVPETHRWARRLQDAGIEVWLVSGSHRWLIAAAARVLGLSADRLLAVSVEVEDGLCTGEVPEPVTYGAGKAHAIRRQLPGRQPDFAIGNTIADRYMLEMAPFAVAFEPDADLLALAEERGWAVIRG